MRKTKSKTPAKPAKPADQLSQTELAAATAGLTFNGAQPKPLVPAI